MSERSFKYKQFCTSDLASHDLMQPNLIYNQEFQGAKNDVASYFSNKTVGYEGSLTEEFHKEAIWDDPSKRIRKYTEEDINSKLHQKLENICDPNKNKVKSVDDNIEVENCRGSFFNLFFTKTSDKDLEFNQYISGFGQTFCPKDVKSHSEELKKLPQDNLELYYSPNYLISDKNVENNSKTLNVKVYDFCGFFSDKPKLLNSIKVNKKKFVINGTTYDGKFLFWREFLKNDDEGIDKIQGSSFDIMQKMDKLSVIRYDKNKSNTEL